MDILRIAPYNLQVSIDVSLPNIEYEYFVTDNSDSSTPLQGLIVSDSSSTIAVPLPPDYDGKYTVIADTEEHEFEVVRPYVDPTSKGTTASEIATYSKNERIARAIIDSVIQDGFYYSKKVVEAVGIGADYLPIWKNSKKLLKLYENNVLIFDANNPDSYSVKYSLTQDKFAVQESSDFAFNRNESAQNILPASSSDSMELNYTYRGFPRGFDYKVMLETGYKKVPSDIVLATEMLIDDLECGRLDYYKRYVSDYNTDQFKIKFDSAIFNGTGNILVDKILSKYYVAIRTLGIL